MPRFAPIAYHSQKFSHPRIRLASLGVCGPPTFPLSKRIELPPNNFGRGTPLPYMYIYSIPAILSPCLQMETQPRCIPRYFCNKVERICAIYLISTLADCTLPLWKNDIFTLSFSLRECRNTMYFHTSIALVVIEEEKSEKSKNKKSRTISHIWEIPLRLL